MKYSIKVSAFAIIALSLVFFNNCQDRPTTPAPTTAGTPPFPSAPPRTAPKPYKEVIN
jgi:hypothetical protein